MNEWSNFNRIIHRNQTELCTGKYIILNGYLRICLLHFGGNVFGVFQCFVDLGDVFLCVRHKWSVVKSAYGEQGTLFIMDLSVRNAHVVCIGNVLCKVAECRLKWPCMFMLQSAWRF